MEFLEARGCVSIPHIREVPKQSRPCPFLDNAKECSLSFTLVPQAQTPESIPFQLYKSPVTESLGISITTPQPCPEGMAAGESLAYLIAALPSFQVSLQVGPLSSIFCWNQGFQALCANLNQVARVWADEPHRNTHDFHEELER